MGTGTTAVLTGLVQSVSGLAGNIAANDYVEIAKRFRPSAEVLRNRHLTRAVGMAIAVVIKHAATNPEFRSYKNELDKLASKAVKNYPAIAEANSDKIFHGIQEEQLPAIFSAKAEEFGQVKVLDSEVWGQLLDWLKSIEELVILPNFVIRYVADELHNTFPQALREVLKEDAANEGKAFSELILSLLGEITADLRDLRAELNQKNNRILEEVQRLSAMPSAPGVTQGFQQLLDLVQSGLSEELKTITQQLIGIEAKVDQVQNTASQTLDNTEQIKERLNQLTPQYPITISGKLDLTRPSLNYWQGRQKEIEQIQKWLDDQNVSLIGIIAAGGYGKSTLAAKIYENCLGFTDKLWVNVSQPISFSFLGRELLLKLFNCKVDEQMPDDQLARQLVTHLRDDGQYLLVLDNLESLLQPDGQWRDDAYQGFLNCWLSYGDRSVILVTTQEKPNLPEQNARWQRLDGLERFEGAALLTEQGIQGSEAELQDFAEQVDGHPLLLSLVVGFLWADEGGNPPLSALRREDIDLFQVIGLHRGQPNISVGKVFDASFDRLDRRLQTLLLNVGVYRPPFNVVAGAVMLSEVGEEELASTLSQTKQDLRLLVRRSLLQEQRNATGEHRFRFQSLILDYVKQKARNLTEAHERAIRYYLETAKEQLSWTSDTDSAEYFEIFHHRCELKQYALANDTLNTCYEFLYRRGYNLRLVSLYEQLVQSWQPTSLQDQLNLGWAWNRLGIGYRSLGQYQRATKCHQQSLKIAREIGDRWGEANSLGNQRNTCVSLGEYPQAIEFYQQQLDIAQEMQQLDIAQKKMYRRGEASALGGLGYVYQSLEQYPQAIKFHQQCLRIMQEIEDRLGEARAISGLGNAHASLEQYPQAIKFHQQCLEIMREERNCQGEAQAWFNLGITWQKLHEKPQAITAYRNARELYQAMELDEGVQNCDNAIQRLEVADLAASNRSAEAYPQPAPKRSWLQATINWFQRWCQRLKSLNMI